MTIQLDSTMWSSTCFDWLAMVQGAELWPQEEGHALLDDLEF